MLHTSICLVVLWRWAQSFLLCAQWPHTIPITLDSARVIDLPIGKSRADFKKWHLIQWIAPDLWTLLIPCSKTQKIAHWMTRSSRGLFRVWFCEEGIWSRLFRCALSFILMSSLLLPADGPQEFYGRRSKAFFLLYSTSSLISFSET